MKTKTWILIFTAAALVCGGFLLARQLLPKGNTAEIYQDNQLVKTVDLSKDQTFTLYSSDGGWNTIVVSGGKISVTEASCPDKVCVNHGPAGAGDPVICLPNKLVIRLTDSGGTDASVG